MLEKELEIFLSDAQVADHILEVYIHTADRDIKAYKLESFDVIADFNVAYTDRLVAVAVFRTVDVVEHIIPNAANLEMTIVKHTTAEDFIYRTKAVIPDEVIRGLGFGHLSRRHSGQLDIIGLTHIEIHGKYQFAEIASTLAVSGNFLNTALDTLLSKVIKHQTKQVTNAAGKTLEEVIIHKLNNAEVYRQVIVPTGTHLLKLPSYLQQKYGLYTTAVGSYLRPFEDATSTWWIYPVYGNIVWSDKFPTLRVFVFYDKKADVLYNTIQRDGNTLLIIAELIEHQNPVSDTRPGMRNTSMTVVDMHKSLETPSAYEEGKVIVSSTDRVKPIKAYNRVDGTDAIAALAPRTNNFYKAAAALTANTTETLAFKWHRGIQELLIPGMLVEVLLDNGRYVEQSLGRLNTSHSVCTATGTLASEARHVESVIFSVNFEVVQ